MSDELFVVESMCERLQDSCNLLISSIGPIKIGKRSQFPYGWRKAAKGRTVWRIVEEIITQNLEKHHIRFGLLDVKTSESDVSVYDMECRYRNLPSLYINIKSAISGGKKNKDDISKASGLREFYAEDNRRNFFIATFYISFKDNMTIEIEKCVVFPLAWIPDIYVNPSNNGNLQSAYYKDLNNAVKRTNEEFINLLEKEIQIANKKKNLKNHHTNL